MIAPEDLEHCRNAIRHGSLSFYAASKLLPAKVRDPALALYAFCRLADDEVDEGEYQAGAVFRLQERLDAAYAGAPRNAPEDRAFAAIIEEFEMPRALPEALLEGLAWDAGGREYHSLSDVLAYSARVASAVGAMMCVLMRVRDADALARSCDLGAAMQLTNIARDVGEDARMGRIYLPLDWLEEKGIAPDNFLREPLPTNELRRLVKRLLAEADRLYLRSEAGINVLPLRARTGIWAARLIYAGIGKQLRQQGYDSISMRARTTGAQKLGWLAQSAARTAGSLIMPTSAVIYAQPLPECAFLVDAASRPGQSTGRHSAVLDVLADLRAREQSVGRGRPLA
ncbi:MAG: phytoene/squalene synthase family protein [Pseudomonadota bacterium]